MVEMCHLSCWYNVIIQSRQVSLSNIHEFECLSDAKNIAQLFIITMRMENSGNVLQQETFYPLNNYQLNSIHVKSNLPGMVTFI